MIEPLLADDELLRDVQAARRDPDGFRLWWLGQSGFLLHLPVTTFCWILTSQIH